MLSFTNLNALQFTQKLLQLERDISRVTLDEEGCAKLNQIVEKHKLDEINQRVELASDPSRADPRQPGINSQLLVFFSYLQQNLQMCIAISSFQWKFDYFPSNILGGFFPSKRQGKATSDQAAKRRKVTRLTTVNTKRGARPTKDNHTPLIQQCIEAKPSDGVW